MKYEGRFALSDASGYLAATVERLTDATLNTTTLVETESVTAILGAAKDVQDRIDRFLAELAPLPLEEEVAVVATEATT